MSLNPSGSQFLLEYIWHNSTARWRGYDESVCSLLAKDMLGQGTYCVLVSVGSQLCMSLAPAFEYSRQEVQMRWRHVRLDSQSYGV